VKKRVADRDIRDLLWKFLRAGVLEPGQHKDTLTGTPQGGIVSPLLANIYLHELDWSMESTSRHLTANQRKRQRAQGNSNFLYVRYADDFVVLCNGTKAQARAMKEELRSVLAHMGLTLSEEKTKITHITEGFTFLGYWIERSKGTTGSMVPKVRIPASAMKRFRHNAREILAPSTAGGSASAKIHALNYLTRGWCHYDRITNSPSVVFTQVSYEVFWDMAHWLGRKYKCNMPAIMRRFLHGSTLGTKTTTLVLPTAYKARKRLVKVLYNPYTKEENIERERPFSYEDLWSGVEQAHAGWADLREEVLLSKSTTCAICGTGLHPSEAEIDHILPRAQFKDPQEADRMDNLQILCTPCHRAKTKTDRKVLSRMP
jgi:RNA-directed DNA polymerase